MEEIKIKDIVYIVSEPHRKGVVLSLKPVGARILYTVFLDGMPQTFFDGQIARQPEETLEWTDARSLVNRLTAYQINHPSGENLYSLNAARIEFVPYQFRPAMKLIQADEPRLLIADSVGVGKTIEAGLIMKELEARGELERVMVICPKPLVAERKWEQELRRFDEDFIALDGPALRECLENTQRDGVWPIRYSKVIVPYSVLDSRALGGQGQGGTGLADLEPPPQFDLVIVDEAHNIRNGSLRSEKAFQYKCVYKLCESAKAVVMLTATPLQTGDRDLFTLLNLLRPDLILDQETFSTMAKPNAFIFQAARLLRQGRQEEARQALEAVRDTQWGRDYLCGDPRYQEIQDALREPLSRQARVRLMTETEALNSFHTLISRTRRRDIQDFTVRRSHTVSSCFTSYQAELYEALLSFEQRALAALHGVRGVPFMISTLRRQAASCIFGLSPCLRDLIGRRLAQLEDDPEIDLEEYLPDADTAGTLRGLAARVLELSANLPTEDPKFEQALDLIQEKQEQENNKVMLFSSFRHTLAYLRGKLEQRGVRVAQVDGSVKDEERYALKNRFALPRHAPEALDVLLFTEVGSEGLDYQFCDMMINYDLPWNPMRVEQRIGRIDRRGQHSPAVNIFNMVTEGTVDADIYHRCLWRIGVFQRSVGDCEAILGDIAQEIGRLAVDPSLTDAERREKLEQMADNEVRKVQEMENLEQEEGALFGFDLTQYLDSEAVRRAANPWLTPESLEALVRQYLEARGDSPNALLGDGPLKLLRLRKSVRTILLEDARALPGGRNAQRQEWERYLSGSQAGHSVSFDAGAAREDPECFFFTPMHPLLRQAAAYFASQSVSMVYLHAACPEVPEGSYPFSVYAWRYVGLQPHFRLVIICENERLAELLPELLPQTRGGGSPVPAACHWDALELLHLRRWEAERARHREKAAQRAAYQLETLTLSYHRSRRKLEEELESSLNERYRAIKRGELEKAQASFQRKAEELHSAAQRGDIHPELLANGVILIEKGEGT